MTENKTFLRRIFLRHRLLAGAIRTQTSECDCLAGEKMVQGFLAAYLEAKDYFPFDTGGS